MRRALLASLLLLSSLSAAMPQAGYPTGPAIGSSGATIPLLNGANNIWTNAQTIGVGAGAPNLTINGASSGSAAGPLIQFQGGGVTAHGLGYASAILGGAFDATALWYGGGNSMAIRGSGTTGCSSGIQTAVTTGVISCVVSSIRFKNNIQPLTTGDALAVVMKLRPASWTYRTDAPTADAGQDAVGLIAENVAEADPRLVGYDAEGRPFTLRPDRIIGELVAVIQDQQRRLLVLEGR